MTHMPHRLAVACVLAAALAAPAVVAQARRPPAAPAAREFDVMEKTISELQAAMEAGAVTSRELVALYLARIQAYDHDGPRLNAMIALNPQALDAANALDRERAGGRVRGPLHGIPIVVKDNFETADMPTTGGSLALAGFRTGRDAFVVRKLRDAGAVIVGKTNLHELASGITSVSSVGGQTRNPYDPSRTPGGSSGGTGAAVAANFAVSGMGSDTCGSIRIPAANNNLVGLRGTLGLSSRSGIIPLSHTQDIGGPLARTVTDLALMLDATVGRDPGDATTAASDGHIPASYRAALGAGSLKGARIGVLKNLFGTAPEDDEAGGIVRRALDAMKKEGADIAEVTIPGLEDQLNGSSVINAEFKFDLIDYLAQFPNAPVHSLGDIMDRGLYHRELEANFKTRNAIEARESDAYRRARVRRATVRDLVAGALQEQRVDALAYPVLRRRPAAIGEPQRGTNCQLSASAGLPAISLPAGLTDDGVPIGVELMGAAWSEPRLLALAYAYEQATHPRRPPPTTPALINGKAPAPVSISGMLTSDAGAATARFTFRFDVVRGTLSFEFVPPPGGAIASAVLRHGANGPIIAVLLNPSESVLAGNAALGASTRTALGAGRAVRQRRHRPRRRAARPSGRLRQPEALRDFARPLKIERLNPSATVSLTAIRICVWSDIMRMICAALASATLAVSVCAQTAGVWDKLPARTGWISVGEINVAQQSWATAQHTEIVKRSPGEESLVSKAGDQLKITDDEPLVILGYEKTGEANGLMSPSGHRITKDDSVGLLVIGSLVEIQEP
jgi:amidase